MEWLINKLKEDLRTLQNNYNEFVIEGTTKHDSPAAIDSRERYKQYTKAIKILEYHEKILTAGTTVSPAQNKGNIARL